MPYTLFFQKQYETRYISTLVNSMNPDQLASLVNSVDPEIQNCINLIHLYLSKDK